MLFFMLTMVRLYQPIQDPMDRGAWWATVQGVSKQQQPSINISLKVLVALFQKYLTNNNLWKTELHVNNMSYALGLKNIHITHIPIFTYYPRHTHMQTCDTHINACSQTREILQVWFQTTTMKSHEVFGFPLHVKVTFTLFCSLLSVQ